MFSNQRSEPVVGYPVGLPPNMAHFNAMQFQPTPHETMYQQAPRSNQSRSNFHGQVRSDFPVPTPPPGAVFYNPRGEEGSSAYRLTPHPYGPSVDIRTRQPRRGNTALAVLGGALSGLILGEILFWWWSVSRGGYNSYITFNIDIYCTSKDGLFVLISMVILFTLLGPLVAKIVEPPPTGMTVLGGAGSGLILGDVHFWWWSISRGRWCLHKFWHQNLLYISKDGNFRP